MSEPTKPNNQYILIVLGALASGIVSYLSATSQSNSDLAVALGRVQSELGAIDARVSVIETQIKEVNSSRFTDRDADRQTAVIRSEFKADNRAFEISLDELRRRIIRLEQIATGRDLDGRPSPR